MEEKDQELYKDFLEGNEQSFEKIIAKSKSIDYIRHERKTENIDDNENLADIRIT